MQISSPISGSNELFTYLKKILLISDTHSYLDEALLKYIDQSDEVWHAGDIGDISVCQRISERKLLRAVYGNIDDRTVFSEYPEFLHFNCEELKVMITHIGGEPGKYPPAVKKALEENKPGLFICGHSHILKVKYDETYNLLFMNPGACGRHGFHHVKTALRFTTDKNEVKQLEVIELGKRGNLN